jgi:hypothetical protein
MPRVNVWVPDSLHEAAKAAGINFSAAIREGLRLAEQDGERFRVRAKPGQVPTALYRCYDQDGDLLYVGISTNLGKRLATHASEKPWWPQVADIHVELFPSKPAAQAAEVQAISTEEPRYNGHQETRVGPGSSSVLSMRVPRAEVEAWRHAAGDRPLAQWIREEANREAGYVPPAPVGDCPHPRGRRRYGSSGLLVCTVCQEPIR